MILVDNINILKKTYPNSWDNIKLAEVSLNKNLVQLEDSNRGYKTLYVEDNGKKTYIHSKYNPIREAESIIEEYKDIKENSTVIFYGTGLGYHIDAFLNKHSNIDYYIYEPIPELLYQYLSNREIQSLPNKNLKNIILGNRKEVTISFLNNIVGKAKEDLTIIQLPIHKQIFNKEYSEFINLFKTIIKDKRNSVHTNYAFQERWVLNSMINFKEVLLTPNILLNNKDDFKGKTAILVSAGPSLDDEIENLRYIKDNGLAYIFSVGSAINTLLDKNILPDAMCTYDPKIENQQVFKKINEKNISTVPMVFGSSAGFETLQQYKGPKFHMITSQDTISKYYLKVYNNEIEMVNDAPSIAIVTLEMLYKLKFSTIILVGQNLAYRKNKQYSEGIDYHENHIEDLEHKNVTEIEDVYGNQVYTNDGFNRMRRQMETYINIFQDIRVINTTKDGAKINGSVFIPLDIVIKEELKNNIVDKTIFNKLNLPDYDKAYLKKKNLKIKKEYEKIDKLLLDINNILINIKEYKINKNYKQIESMYNKIDIVLDKIEQNDFYKIFIQPTNRVYFDFLYKQINIIAEEKSKLFKVEKVLELFYKTIEVIKKAKDEIGPLFTQFIQMIDSYIQDKSIKEINLVNVSKILNSNLTNQNINNNSKTYYNIMTDPYAYISYDVKSLLSKQYKENIFNRMDTIVRYLAIEEYYGENNCGFRLYDKMQRARGQKIHDIDRFKELIKSIERNGFSKDSSILVDPNLQLVDGSHRLACALYFNLKRISINTQLQPVNIEYSIDWFKDAGFTEEELEVIRNKQKDILIEKEIYSVVILWPPVQKYFDEITNELSNEYKVLSIRDYSFENKHEFVAFVKGQYAVDDIENWKIEKKLEHMNNYDKNIRILTLDIGDPKFRAKAKNSKPISIKVEAIKKKYREKYSKKIENYFYDIIMHIGDNYEHSAHMIKIMQKDIDIIKFLKSIDPYKYALTKVDVPYMPKDFPRSYPLNKDMDILCDKEDYNEICKKVLEFSDQYMDKYEVKIINQGENVRVRFELNKFLIYQIDIGCSVKGLNQSFVVNGIQRRIKHDIYYILDTQDEIVIRLNEYIQNPQKTHHYVYLVSNKEYLKYINLKEIGTSNKYTNQLINLINRVIDDELSILGERFDSNGKSSVLLDHEQQAIRQQVIDKIEKGIYEYEKVNCGICKGDTFDNLCTKERNGIYMPVTICKNCGSIQSNPRMKQESLNEFYNLEFNTLFRNKYSPSEYFNVQYSRGKSLYTFLEKETQLFKNDIKSMHIVEVGCGIGGILKYFKDLGCTVKGVDLGSDYIEYGKKSYELDLEVGTIEDIKDGNKADLIIYRHVMEHILDLEKELELLSQLLKPEGLLYIEVPGVKSLNNSYNQDFVQYLMLSHMHHFTLRSLSNLLKFNSFSIVYGDETIRCIARKSNADRNFNLANDYFDSIDFLLKLERTRENRLDFTEFKS